MATHTSKYSKGEVLILRRPNYSEEDAQVVRIKGVHFGGEEVAYSWMLVNGDTAGQTNESSFFSVEEWTQVRLSEIAAMFPKIMARAGLLRGKVLGANPK
jgi:hypothetical protein